MKTSKFIFDAQYIYRKYSLLYCMYALCFYDKNVMWITYLKDGKTD